MTATTQAPVTAPGSTAHTDGAWAVIPVQTRDERPRSFDPADFEVSGPPSIAGEHPNVQPARAQSPYDERAQSAASAGDEDHRRSVDDTAGGGPAAT